MAPPGQLARQAQSDSEEGGVLKVLGLHRVVGNPQWAAEQRGA
jgi:hypothetical protein